MNEVMLVIAYLCFAFLLLGTLYIIGWFAVHRHEDEPCYYCGEVNCKQLLTSCKKQHSKHYDNWRGPWGDTW